jgi:hypothetical protein
MERFCTMPEVTREDLVTAADAYFTKLVAEAGSPVQWEDDVPHDAEEIRMENARKVLNTAKRQRV